MTAAQRAGLSFSSRDILKQYRSFVVFILTHNRNVSSVPDINLLPLLTLSQNAVWSELEKHSGDGRSVQLSQVPS